MDDFVEFFTRSSWGVILAMSGHPVLGVLIVAATALTVVVCLWRANVRERASWRDERGYGLVELAFALLIVVIALVVLFHYVA